MKLFMSPSDTYLYSTVYCAYNTYIEKILYRISCHYHLVNYMLYRGDWQYCCLMFDQVFVVCIEWQ